MKTFLYSNFKALLVHAQPLRQSCLVRNPRPCLPTIGVRTRLIWHFVYFLNHKNAAATEVQQLWHLKGIITKSSNTNPKHMPYIHIMPSFLIFHVLRIWLEQDISLNPMIQRGILICKQLQPPSACPVVPGCSTGRCSLMIGLPSCFQRGTLQKTSAYPTLGGKGTSSSTQKGFLGYGYQICCSSQEVWFFGDMIHAIVLWCVSILHYVWIILVQGYDKLQVAASGSFCKINSNTNSTWLAGWWSLTKPHSRNCSSITWHDKESDGNSAKIQRKNLWNIRISQYLHGFPPTSKTLLLWPLWIDQKLGWKFPRHQQTVWHRNTSNKNTHKTGGVQLQLAIFEVDLRRPPMKGWVSRTWPLLSLRH